MADEQIVTNIVAKSDFSNLIADLHRVTASLSQLQETSASTNRALSSQIDAINRTFESNLRKTGQFSTHFVSLTSDVDKFGRNLDSGRLKLRDYFNAYQAHTKTSGGLIRDLAKQQVQLQNSILQPLGRNAQGLMQFNVHVPRGLDLVKNKTLLAKQELQIMNKVIQDGGVQLINWGKNTQWAGRQLTVGLSLPIAAFGKAAADAFKVADQELTRLTKVYGDVAGTSSQELGKIRNEVAATAKELSSAMGVSFTETIGLAADIAATGKTGNELLASVSETTRLAVLGEVDRQEALKATLAIQSAFKQNTDELADSINFLNAVENQTSTTLNDLVEAIPKAGPVIKGLGGSVQDLALYLTAMREGGINASEGANALKSALASLINPTDVAVSKFKGFGIDLLGIVNNNAGNVTGTLLALQSALDKLDPLQKQQAIEQLFGKFQFSRLNALFENLGRQGSQTLQVLDLMKASAGELEAVAARELTAVTESASGKYKRAIESLKANLAGIGEDFLNVGTAVVNVFNKLLSIIDKLPDPIKNLLSIGGIFTAITGPLIMLTGLFGNFIGYMIKGYSHIKAFLKGGEGFKLLTPEILATQQAAGLVEQTFYSDAKAAAVLSQAIKTLTSDFAELSVAMAQGSIPVNPTLTTAAGTQVSSYRMVNQQNPLVGGMASAHLNPRDPNNPATIFGLVPQSDLVNQKIGRVPQIMMEERLPDVEGLTSVKKTLKDGRSVDISTGVVASEAARHQALMATLGMQSKQEIEAFKNTVKTGGAVSADLMATFDDILPITQRLSTNAATQSAAIVAELKAGKITVDQARAQIIRVNAELEASLGAEVTAFAASRGRNIDLTKIPLIDQPVVDPVTGKSNMRALTRRGKMRELMYSLGRATRTRMQGAPYSIETTLPKKYNMGGSVFYNNGDQVPGPNVNADVVPAMLTPGEFVIRRGIAQQDPEGMRALNEGRGVIVPIQNRALGGSIMKLLPRMVSRLPRGFIPEGRSKVFARAFFDTKTGSNVTKQREWLNDSMTMFGRLYPKPDGKGYYNPSDIARMSDVEIRGLWKGIEKGHFAAKRDIDGSENYFVPGLMGPQSSSANKKAISGGNASSFADDLENVPIHPMVIMRAAAENLGYKGSPKQFMKAYNALITALRGRGRSRTKPNFGPNDTFEMFAERVLSKHLRRVGGRKNSNFFDEILKYGTVRGPQAARTLGKSGELKSGIGSLYTAQIEGFNKGGMIPGYAGGGRIQAFTKGMIMKKLGAMWGKNDDNPGWSHKSAQIGMGAKLFGRTGLRPYTQNLLYDALLETTANTRPSGYFKAADGKLFRGIEPDQTDQMIRDAAEIVMRRNGKQISPIDKKILREQFTNWDIKQLKSTPGVRKAIFGFNKGGMVPGYRSGGRIPGMQYKNRGGAILKLLAMLGLPLAGQSIGDKVGGIPGSLISTGSFMAPMFMGSGMLGQLRGATGPTVGQRLGTAPDSIGYARQSIFARGGMLGGFSEKVGTAATSGSRFASILGKIALGATRLNIGLTALVAGFILIKKNLDSYYEKQARIASSFGMTAEQAKKAGLEYTDFNKKIKEAIANQQALAERNRLVYESLTLSGTPLNLTIEQYKKLKAEVKKTMPEIIDNLNKMNNIEAKDYAVKLKTQFIAYGDSVDDATKKVYALFASSNKGFLAGSVIAQKAFSDIKSASDAAAKAIDLYSVALDKANGKGQANAVNTAMMSIDTAIADSLKASKGQLTYYDAMKKTLDEINLKTANQKTLSDETIASISMQNPELAEVLKNTDTIVSAWAKYQLLLKGVNLELSSLNAEQAIAVNNAVQLISQTVATKLTASGGALSDESKKLKGLQSQYDALEKQARGLSAKKQIDSRKRIEALQEELNLIKKQADERRKALQEEQETEDINLQIKKKQVEYQSYLAQGRNSEAAQSKIDMEQLVNQRERLFANRAIDQAEEKATKPIENEIKKLQKANQDAADAASLAAEKLNTLGKAIEKLKTTISEVTNAILTVVLGQLLDKNFANTEAGKAALAALEKTLKSTGNVPTDFKPTTTPKSVVNPTGGSPGAGDVGNYQNQTAKDAETARKQLYDAVAGGIQKSLEKTDLVVKAQTVILEAGAVKGEGTSKNPINLGNKATTGVNAINLDAWNGTWGQNSSRGLVKNYAETKNIKPGQYFTMRDPNGKEYKFKMEKDGNITMVYDPTPNKAFGGYISGPGTSTSDSIPANLSNGEYVIRASSVDKYGKNLFDGLNSQKFAMGGYVNPSYSPKMSLPSFEKGINNVPVEEMLALIHKNEAVLPANINPFNPSNNGTMGGTYNISSNVVVNASPGMNTEDLANTVARKIEIKNREAMAKLGVNRSR